MKPSERDEIWMRQALALARRGEGLTRPNPPVGAIIVRQGRMVGAGWHRKAGGPHAEIHALRAAGKRARGATLYVTLEPCSTTGRTPPCTEAIIAAGISRVVVALPDPNPRHASRGLRMLSRRGIEVHRGVCAREAAHLIAPFRMHCTQGRPFVTLKLGMTLDGRIAEAGGRSKWITGLPARRAVQSLRRRADAILVGAETVRMDDPQLLPHPSLGRRPLRVIVSQSGTIPADARVQSDQRSPATLIAVPHTLAPARLRRLRSTKSVILSLPATAGGVSLRSLMTQLARRDVLHVLCEGGGELAAALLRAGLVDELQLFVAPRVLGGSARPSFGGAGWSLRTAPGFSLVSCEQLGCDLHVVARRP